MPSSTQQIPTAPKQRGIEGDTQLLAKDKTISDHAPIKSVMECYGVARSTVQGWVRRTVIDVSSWYPDAGNRDKLAASMMQKGGQRYRQLGRSKKALEARAMK